MRDPDNATHQAYDAGSAWVYLVRPDGYVGFRAPLEDTAALATHLKERFGIGVG